MENTKDKLRESIRLRRQNHQSHFDLTSLTDSPDFQESQVIASYRSFGNEPDTKSLNQLILESGKKLLLPARLPNNSIEFRIWDGDQKGLRLNGKVEEPTGEKFIGKIDLMILPALAIDRKGNRLGQGGGSYDRALKGFKGTSIAIINEGEFLSELPIEDHDQPIKLVLTPTRLIRI